ncbi:MAG: MFS transporter [Alphaproteobacteria bacterium]
MQPTNSPTPHSATELLLFGMLVIMTAIPGAFVGGRLNNRLGSKPTILWSMVILVIASIAAQSITVDSIFFGIEVDPPADGDGMYASVGERFYLFIGAIIGLIAGPLQAASRTLIIALSPRQQMTQFVGMSALSGKLTTFAAAAVVAFVTTIADSQRIGISTPVLFFVVGGLLLRVDPTPQE